MKLQIFERTVTKEKYYVGNLAAFLASKGMTQADLARKFKYSTGYISDIAKVIKPIPLEIKKYLESL